VGVCSNICVVVRKNSCSRVVLRGCGKLRGSKSCEVHFSTSSQPVCVCVCALVTSYAFSNKMSRKTNTYPVSRRGQASGKGYAVENVGNRT